MRKKVFSIALTAVLCMGLSSCEVMQGMFEGMASYPMYGYGVATGYNPEVSSGYTTPSSTSSSTSTCKRCSGSGNCQTCKGTGKKYDYGTASIATHKKYVQNCGVCNGTGRCGVCNGKGSV